MKTVDSKNSSGSFSQGGLFSSDTLDEDIKSVLDNLVLRTSEAILHLENASSKGFVDVGGGLRKNLLWLKNSVQHSLSIGDIDIPNEEEIEDYFRSVYRKIRVPKVDADLVLRMEANRKSIDEDLKKSGDLSQPITSRFINEGIKESHISYLSKNLLPIYDDCVLSVLNEIRVKIVGLGIYDLSRVHVSREAMTLRSEFSVITGSYNRNIRDMVSLHKNDQRIKTSYALGRVYKFLVDIVGKNECDAKAFLKSNFYHE